MSSVFLFANNVSTTLAQSISATTTTINVASGDGSKFPNPSSGQQFAITLVDAATGLTNEICYCTSRSSDQLTVVRAQEGTSATTFSAGDTVAMFITAGEMGLFTQANYLSPFDYNFAQSVGGYQLNAIVADSTTPGMFWYSTTSNNTTSPSSSNSSWQSFYLPDIELSRGQVVYASNLSNNSNSVTAYLNFTPNKTGSMKLDYNCGVSSNQYVVSRLGVSGSGFTRLFSTENWANSTVGVGVGVFSVTKGQAVSMTITANSNGNAGSFLVSAVGVVY